MEKNRKYSDVTLQTWIEAGCQHEAQSWAVAANDAVALKKLKNVTLDHNNLQKLAVLLNYQEMLRKVIANPLVDAYIGKDFADFKIICQDESFPCHKFFLAARSKVFKAMLQNGLKEAQENQVVLKNCEDKVLADHFIRFFYSGEIGEEVLDSIPNLVMLLHLSDFYQVEDLMSLVEEAMVSKLSRHTVKEFLIAGDMYNGTKIKAEAIKFIVKNKGVWKENREEWKQCISRDLLFELVDVLL